MRFAESNGGCGGFPCRDSGSRMIVMDRSKWRVSHGARSHGVQNTTDIMIAPAAAREAVS